jgi:hypothetical protein
MHVVRVSVMVDGTNLGLQPDLDPKLNTVLVYHAKLVFTLTGQSYNPIQMMVMCIPLNLSLVILALKTYPTSVLSFRRFLMLVHLLLSSFTFIFGSFGLC